MAENMNIVFILMKVCFIMSGGEVTPNGFKTTHVPESTFCQKHDVRSDRSRRYEE